MSGTIKGLCYICVKHACFVQNVAMKNAACIDRVFFGDFFGDDRQRDRLFA